MFKARKAVIEITTLITLVTFLGTGVYKMFVIQKQVNYYKKQNESIIELQNKYCSIIHPTEEQITYCKELLKISVPKNK